MAFLLEFPSDRVTEESLKFRREPFAPESHVDLLFPGPPPGRLPDEAGLKAIRQRMISRSTPVTGQTSAIMTYIGQMIAHEIVPSTSLFPNLRVDPSMNLGSIYGHGGANNPRPELDAEGRFIIGKLPGDARIGSDLPRGAFSANALIADPRNDENHLVAQMHTTWLRFHNKVLDYGYKAHECDPRGYARAITTKAFQFVAITDFMRAMIDRVVFDQYLRSGPVLLDDPSRFTHIPGSFAFAGFRIGHSMIRNSYTLNLRRGRKRRHPMRSLFSRFRETPLSIEEIVDWRVIDRQRAGRIDCGIVRAMGMPPFDGSMRSIVEINLEQGAKLPAGFDCARFVMSKNTALARRIGLNSLDQSALDEGRLQSLNLDIETLPLWLYILQEADVSSSYGARLGRLGSVIVAEVLLASVRAAPESIFSVLSESFTRWCEWLGPFGHFLAQRRSANDSRVRFLDVFEFVQSP